MKIKKLNAPADVSDVVAKPGGVAANDPIAGLEKEAAALEGAAVAQEHAAESKQEKQATDTLELDLLSAFDMAAAPARPAMWWLNDEQFEALWGRKVRVGVAEPAAVLMRRHGMTLGDVMNKYGPYVALLGALGPSVAGTVAIYKIEKQKLIEQQRAGDGTSVKAG